MRTVAEKRWWGKERSVCDSCGRVLSPYELVPILSYVFLGGRCRSCGERIPARHLSTEAAAAVLGALFVLRWGMTAPLAFSFAALFFLLFHALTDIESGYIYDAWCWSMAACAAFLRLWGGPPSLIDGALGATLGFCVIYVVLLVSRNGMGEGDAMLMLGTGAILGWKMTVLCLYLGFIAGGAAMIPLLIMKEVSRKDAVPLAPFLAFGAMAAIFSAASFFDFFGFRLSWPWI